MLYKSEYTRRKKMDSIFLEITVRPDWANDFGKIIPIEYIRYKIIAKTEKYGKIKVVLYIYDTDNYQMWIISKYCRKYIENTWEHGEGIYSPSLREFFRFLRNFENDLQMRLNDIYISYKDEMDQNCRKLVEEILEKL